MSPAMPLVGGVIAPWGSSGLCPGPRVPRPPAGSSLCPLEEEAHALACGLQSTRAAGCWVGREHVWRRWGLVGSLVWRKVAAGWFLNGPFKASLSKDGRGVSVLYFPLYRSTLARVPLSRAASCLGTKMVPGEAAGRGGPTGAAQCHRPLPGLRVSPCPPRPAAL